MYFFSSLKLHVRKIYEKGESVEGEDLFAWSNSRKMRQWRDFDELLCYVFASLGVLNELESRNASSQIPLIYMLVTSVYFRKTFNW